MIYTDSMQLACDHSVSKCFLLNKENVFANKCLDPITQSYNHSNHSTACNHSNHKVNSCVSDKKKIFFPKKILNGRHRACDTTHISRLITILTSEKHISMEHQDHTVHIPSDS